MNLLIGLTAKGYAGEWDPTNPSYSTNGHYDPAKLKAPGPFAIFRPVFVELSLRHLRPSDEPVARLLTVNPNSDEVSSFHVIPFRDPVSETILHDVATNPMPVITKLVVSKLGEDVTITSTKIDIHSHPGGIAMPSVPYIEQTTVTMTWPE